VRETRHGVWADGARYEAYIGRWSRPIAREFVAWLDRLPGAQWLDVGSGTGALAEEILAVADAGSVVCVEPSAALIEFARSRIVDGRVTFVREDAARLPAADGEVDVVASGLVLNFLPDPAAAVQEMKRAVRPGGVVAAYVWDYAGEMQMLRQLLGCCR
jgi:ubiquinone/menaquinone biosynthesis C-methylase UbiE